MGRWRFAAASLLALVGCVAEGAPDSRLPERGWDWVEISDGSVAPAIAARLSEAPPGYRGARETWPALRAFYAARQDRPLWFDARGATDGAAALLSALSDAASDGLDPADYDLPGLDAALGLAEWGDPLAVANADVLLTAAFTRYGLDLAVGRIAPAKLDWNTRHRKIAAPQVLGSLGDPPDAAAAAELLRPGHPQYAQLRAALNQLRALEASGGWPEISAGPALAEGSRGPRVAQVRARLRATGDLQADAEDPELYDGELADAVARYQERNGLVADGVIGEQTLSDLEVPLSERIAQIGLNLERWRWMPDDLGERYVLVNVPTFELSAYEEGEPVLWMRIIAGQPEPDWETPVFTANLGAVQFHPEWTVPSKIFDEEIVPRLQKDPGLLERLGLRVVSRGDGLEIDASSIDWSSVGAADELPYLFIQPAGDDNPLGKAKFLMPNPYTVYLHGTPNGDLFSEPERAFSHGCVRVEEPEALAEWALDGVPEWPPERIAQAIEDGWDAELAIAARPPRVHLVYFTAWAQDDGTVRFGPDLYRKDEAMRGLLSQPAEKVSAPP